MITRYEIDDVILRSKQLGLIVGGGFLGLILTVLRNLIALSLLIPLYLLCGSFPRYFSLKGGDNDFEGGRS